MSMQNIYDKLKQAIGNDYGVFGLMGNLMAESNLISTNLQDSFNQKFGLTDEQYTTNVDKGYYSETSFISDGAGYGLAQWTYKSRKKDLYEYAKKEGTSIGNEDMQVSFLVSELLRNYPKVLTMLKCAKSIEEASNYVLHNFEKPADQSSVVENKRIVYSEQIKDALERSGKMSNSSLITCTVLSPNNSGERTHIIDRITPHCVVGQLSAKAIGNCFKSSSRKASCNYGIGAEGGVCLVVDESKRSWCSSSSSNDQRAVTIECASDKASPYAFNDTVYNKLIELCVDICKRNGKSKLLWFGDKEETLAYEPKSDEMVLTVHRWFANKACPGDWLYKRLGDLSTTVTAKLTSSTLSSKKSTTSNTISTVNYKVRVKISNLNIRKGAGTNYEATGTLKAGVYTIVAEASGKGSTKWGKLKSGAGWIALDYATKV